MEKLTENSIEQSIIDHLVSKGYTYFNGTAISPIGENPQRESFSSVLLENHFKDSLKKLNPTLPESARLEAYQKVINLGTEDIEVSLRLFRSHSLSKDILSSFIVRLGDPQAPYICT